MSIGTGKTCSAILIAELKREIIHSKIIIKVPINTNDEICQIKPIDHICDTNDELEFKQDFKIFDKY